MTERIRLIFARQGQGKSRLIWDFLQAEKPPRLFLWDSLHEYDPKTMGGGEPIGAEFREYREILRYLHHDGRPLDRFRIVYRPECEPIHRHLDDFARLALSAGDCAFVVDEADLAVSAWTISPKLNAIVQQGRHYKVSLILATRRPADIPKKVTSQADTVYIGAMHEAGDLKYFKDCFGPRALAAREVPAFGFVRWRPLPGAPAEVVILDAERREVTIGEETHEEAPDDGNRGPETSGEHGP